MTKYYDCIEFWKRQGVEKEENLIALALNDCGELTPHYESVLNTILPIVIGVKDKSKDGFLIGKGL